MNPSDLLEYRFDDLLFQIIKGRNTHEGFEKGLRYEEFEQVKEWRSKYGYKFEIYSNDHLIDNKPHFHLTNFEKKINCRLFLTGEIIDCKGPVSIDKKLKKRFHTFFQKKENVRLIIEFWNSKNPKYKYSSS